MIDENMEELSPDARMLLELEKGTPLPENLPTTALWDRLQNTLGPSAPFPEAGGDGGDAPAPSEAVAQAASSLWPKALVSAALVAVGATGGAAGTYAVMSSASGPPTPTAAVAVAVVAPAPAAHSSPEPSPQPAAPEPVAKPAASRPALTTQEALDVERQILERARTALLRRDLESATTALREHQRRFARGRLSEERDAMLVQVLAMGGHKLEAAEAAATFHARYPDSLFLPAVDAALGGP